MSHTGVTTALTFDQNLCHPGDSLGVVGLKPRCASCRRQPVEAYGRCHACRAYLAAVGGDCGPELIGLRSLRDFLRAKIRERGGDPGRVLSITKLKAQLYALLTVPPQDAEQ